MILRLILFILTYAAVFGAPSYAVWRLALKPRWKRYQQRLQGRRHARELQAHHDMICFECLEDCTEADCFEPKYGWYHAKCFKAL